VTVVALVAFATSHRAENLRFFFAFILTWIIGGTVLATIFSSVGPCYYGFVYPGSDPFQPLLEGLDALNQHVPVFARGVQAMLWDGQTNPASGKLSGVSAMPSMHIATVFLLTRIAFVHHRRLGYASAVAGGLIFVGSILLAWHYAIDGIVGALVAWAAWSVAGVILRRRQTAPEVK
jgi:membrane-associated phospholipid phosphatase